MIGQLKQSLNSKIIVLVYILKKIKINTSEMEIAKLAGTDESGTLMYGLQHAAQLKGLNAVGMKLSLDDLKTNNVYLWISTNPVALQANILTTEEMKGIKGKGMIYVWRYGKYYTWSHWHYGIYHPIGFSFDGSKIYYFTLKGWHWEYYWGPEYGWYKKEIWYPSHMTLPSNFAGYA